MNQRIQELMQEADRRCSETRGVYDLILAELIVRECADIATMNQFQHDAVGNYVLKHFGIR